ncbi:hypothetical protein [Lysinibacillus sphaericus]|uniref:hypothetical protein n=1 Tax=Lysinibacillus sphaericus TaxID=1421 RepID=UPI000C1746B0|nr:hypothetical protein [Lysinibacillus sphaericus]PIJ98155.1 hypothetical protein CTN02_10460 [Lysinibacillus sphaericus]
MNSTNLNTNLEHTMDLFLNYPYMQDVITEHKLENDLHRIKWHFFEEEYVKGQFEKILETFELLTSSNIPNIISGRSNAVQDYITIGNQLHVFSREQARHELNLSNEEVARLFSKVELGGAKFCTKNAPQQL